jgi:hypothetical protein
MRTRRRFSGEFKAEVALETIQGHRTVAELGIKKRTVERRRLGVVTCRSRYTEVSEFVADGVLEGASPRPESDDS